MGSPLSQLAWEPSCLLEPSHDPALEAYARRASGFPHPWIRYFARSPWLARALVSWQPEHGLLTELDLPTADLIGLIVSQENSCRYCYAAVRALLHIQGMSEAHIQRLEQQLAQLDLQPRLAAVVHYTRRLSRSNPPPDAAAVEALRTAGFSEPAIREIAYTVVATAMANRLTTIAAVPPQEFEAMPDTLTVRWLRPLLARWMAAHRRPGQAAAPPARKEGPFQGLVAAYGESPIAALLAVTIDGMCESSLLSPRCRALLLAIIARGLGSDQAEAEARSWLAAQGQDPALVQQVLTHLAAPALDEVERALLPFARETIWYEPQQIQRRARQLREQLDAAQLTEALGMVALGNGLCRLQLALAAEGS